MENVFFKTTTTLELIVEKGKAKHQATSFSLDVSKNLNKEKYFNSKNILSEEGCKAVSNVLIHGIIGNIHLAHEKGFRDSAEHLRWIISEIEQGFASIVKITETNT